MKILAIETSCDETAVALVESGVHILSNVVASQIDIHKKFGGVVPELASRAHEDVLISLVDESLKQASCSLEEVDAFAVTSGPGLVGALMVGVNCAKTLATFYKKPLIAINHLEAHIYANSMGQSLDLPCLSLIVSGGHTILVRVDGWGEYKLVGQTRDDAAGEAFDKVAQMLDLGYPGGPVIDRIAKKGNPEAIAFPRARVKDNPFDFSFSGLKTAVLYYLKTNPPESIEDICASFQEAVVDVLCQKALLALEKEQLTHLCVGGGVSLNSRLKEVAEERCLKNGFSVNFPLRNLCTDNAAMIGGLAYEKTKKKRFDDIFLDANPKDSFFEKINW